VDEQQQPANDVNELENVRADRDRLSVQLHEAENTIDRLSVQLHEAENTIENLNFHIDRYENIIEDLKCELRNAGVDHVELEESWYTELKNERLQDEMRL
jgi:septal ring factor EnvC (AmiA/AmiB activator)